MFKKYHIIPFLIIFSQATETHFKTGVNLHSLGLGTEYIPNFSVGSSFPSLYIASEIRQPIDEKISFGLSGAYTTTSKKGDFYSLQLGMSAYFQQQPHNYVGVGIHIHKVPMTLLEPAAYGYINQLTTGLTLQGGITKNTYISFEFTRDITPNGIHTWEGYPSREEEVGIAFLSSLLSTSGYSSSVGIGYQLPNEI